MFILIKTTISSHFDHPHSNALKNRIYSPGKPFEFVKVDAFSGSILFCVQFIVPLTTIAFCYSMISIRLRKVFYYFLSAFSTGNLLEKCPTISMQYDPLDLNRTLDIFWHFWIWTSDQDLSDSVLWNHQYCLYVRKFRRCRCMLFIAIAIFRSWSGFQNTKNVYEVSEMLQGMMMKRSESSSVPLSSQRQQALKRRMRTNRMLICMVGAFTASWLPSVVFNFLRDYESLPRFVCLSHTKLQISILYLQIEKVSVKGRRNVAVEVDLDRKNKKNRRSRLILFT